MTARDLIGRTAFFGKLPVRGDFVRGGALEPELSGWISALVERARGVLPKGTVRFVALEGDDRCVVGAWVPSRDEVGRVFPLAAFRELPREIADCSWALLPLYCGRFLSDLELCLRAATTRDVDWLMAAIDSVSAPHASELPGILHDARESVAQLRIDDFARRVFEGAPREQLRYALGTMARAAQLDEALTLDLLAPTSFDLFVWLELLCAMLPGGGPPGMVTWTLDGRGLACLGQPSDEVMTYLIDPRHRGNRRWPLWTEHLESVPIALASLPQEVLAIVEGNGSLAELLHAARTVRSD